jgi:hypothetical protein
MTEFYVDINTILANYKQTHPTFKEQVSRFKVRMNRAKHNCDKNGGVISDNDSRYLHDTIKQLCQISLLNTTSLDLMSLTYSREQITHIMERLAYDVYSKNRQTTFKGRDHFIGAIISRLNLVHDLFRVVANSTATTDEYTSVYENVSATGYYPYDDWNSIVRRALGDDTITLFEEREFHREMMHLDDHTWGSGFRVEVCYNTAERDRVYALLRDRVPEFTVIQEAHREWLAQYNAGENYEYHRDLIRAVFENIRREFGITSTCEGVITNIREYVDNYIMENILDNHLIKWV